MTNYTVTKKSDGKVVYRFESETKTIWDQFPESSHNYTPDATPQEIAPILRVYGGRRTLSKLELRRLFSRPELNGIDAFAVGYMSMGLGTQAEDNIRTNLKSYDEAENISLDDPDILMGLSLYVAMGIIAGSRIAEVLNG